MRVLSIHDDCAAPGGTNTYRVQLRDMLRRRGAHVALFTHVADGSDADAPAYCYRYAGGARRGRRHVEHFYVNPSLIVELRGWIAQVKPDVIHLHHSYRFPTSVLLACRGNVPVIQTVHDFRLLCAVDTAEPATPPSTCRRCLGAICTYRSHVRGGARLDRAVRCVWPRTFLRGLLKRTVDRFIAPSRALAADLRAQSFRTCFLPYPLDCSAYPVTVPSRHGKTVLFAGYLHSSKGVDVLLRAFARVIAAVPTARLEIVGDGPCDAELRALSAAVNVDGAVRFNGAVPHAAMRDFYRGANVVVLPSVVSENSPLCIQEALASGRPVVASDIGGIPELLSAGGGVVFAPGDDAELAQHLVRLLENDDEARRMGMAGRTFMEGLCPPDRHLEQYLTLASAA